MDTNTCGKCHQELPVSEFNKDRSRKSGYAWHCKKCRKEYDQGYHSDNRTERLENMRKVSYARRYKISIEQYDAMFEQQNNQCAICGDSAGYKGKRLAVDHNHETGEIRGLLCDRCNLVLGKVKDNPDLLAEMVAYLKSYE